MHGMKFYDFVNERGGKVTLEAIAKPESSWASPLAAFEAILNEPGMVGMIVRHKQVIQVFEGKPLALETGLQFRKRAGPAHIDE